MIQGVATKVIAATCSLTAFSVGIIAGLLANNPAETVLLRAIVGLVIGHAVGLVVGAVAERTVREGATTYQKNNPVPEQRPTMPGGAVTPSPGAALPT